MTDTATEERAIRERNLARVRSAFAAIAAGDAEGQLSHYTDDVIFELPYTDPPKRSTSRAEALANIAAAFTVFRFELTITAVHECLDPDELIVEFTGGGSYLPTGAPYANVYIAVFRFRDGLICYQREFFNPATTAKVIAGT
jgi:ketosteroid isomerase-like protein